MKNNENNIESYELSNSNNESDGNTEYFNLQIKLPNH